jgi:hypothetical protein
VARDASVAKAGYFPLDAAGFDDIASVLRVPAAKYGPSGHLTMLDPCAGQGESLRLARALGRKHWTAADTTRTTPRNVAVDVRWCEMEDTRAAACVAAWEAAEREQKARWSLGGERGYLRREVSCETATGDAFRLPPLGAFASSGKGTCAGERAWASLLYLNPPYDDDAVYGRLEARWLDRFTQHVVDNGVLVFVVPLVAVQAAAEILARRWTDIRVGRVRAGSASAAFASTQVVVLARRMCPDLAAPAPGVVARLVALVAAGVDALPGVADLEPVDVPDTAAPPIPGWAWKCDEIDVAAAVVEHVPWHRSVRRPAANARRKPPVVPVREALPTDRTWAQLSSREYPTLMPLKPAYVADAIASGALDGELVESADGASPPVLVKGMFDRRFREVDVKYDSKGEARTSVQVQRPSLRVSVLDPAAGTVHVLGDSALPTGATDLAGFTVGDLVSRYGPSLAAALARRCPVIVHDGADVAPRPLGLRRPLYVAQAAAVDAAARRLLSLAVARAAGRTSIASAVLLQGQPGTGKTSMSLAIARATGARRVLVICPPHLVAEEAAWLSDCAAVLGSGPVANRPDLGHGSTTYVISSVLDLAAYEAAVSAADAAGDERTHVAVCSREVAKLGHGHDGVAGGKCPRCGAVDSREPAKLAATRARCKAPALVSTGPHRLRVAASYAARAIAWCSPMPTIDEYLPVGSFAARWRVKSGLCDGTDVDTTKRARGFVSSLAREAVAEVNAYVAAVLRASVKSPLSKSQAQIIDTLRDAADNVSAQMSVASVERLLSMLRTFAPVVRAGRVVRSKVTGEIAASLECGEPLYQATPRPRRWPLVRALVAAAKRRAFDLLVLDEAHEYGNYDSAQAQAAERLISCGVPVVFATGTACNGYMSSMHAFFRALSPDYARDFARDDRPAAVARFGYQRRQVDLTGKAPKSVDDLLELGAVSDRVVKGGVKVTGQAPGILPEALLRYLAPATAQVHLDDLGVDLPPISDVRVDVEPTAEQATGLAYLAGALVERIRQDRMDPAKAGKLFGQFAGLPSFLDRCNLPRVAVDGWVVSYPAETPAAAKRGERGDEVARLPVMRPNGGDILLPPASEVLPKEAALVSWIVAQLRRGRPCLVYVWHWDLLPRVADAIRTALATADLSPAGAGELGSGMWLPGDPDGSDKRLSPTVVNVSVLDPGKVPPVKREAWIGRCAAARNAVLLTNPAAVKTGINSLARWWSSAAWFEGPGCSPEIRRQATHRLHRVGQRRPVEVASFVYSGTMQAALHELLLSKVGVSEAVDGLDASAALAAAGVGEGDALASLEVGRALYAWCERAGFRG